MLRIRSFVIGLWLIAAIISGEILVIRHAVDPQVKVIGVSLLVLSIVLILLYCFVMRFADRTVKVRNEFIGVASHELKTPLTNVKLRAELLQTLVTTDEQKECLIKLHESIEHLARLMDDLLDITRIETGKFIIKPVHADFIKAVKEALNQFHYQNLQVDMPQSLEGDFDFDKICQVIINLLSNAVKYGNNGLIKIKVEGPILLQERLEQVWCARFEIKDSGLGIPKSEQTKIFKSFERVGDTKRIQGMGLGLFISNQIVLAHGGRIALKSSPGKGSTFVVILPIRCVPQKNSETV